MLPLLVEGAAILPKCCCLWEMVSIIPNAHTYTKTPLLLKHRRIYIGCHTAICCCRFCIVVVGLVRTSCDWNRDSHASWTTILIDFKSPSHTLSLRRHHKHQSIIAMSLLLSIVNLHNKQKKQSAKLIASFTVSRISFQIQPFVK